MMSATDFDLRLKHIEEQYRARREGAEAYRDQEMARLFEECEWTQEKIARHMGKKQAWVSYRLKFGAFLRFITACDKSHLVQSLTEGRFREHWKLTKGKDSERFAEVLSRLENGISHSLEAMRNKPGIRKAVIEALADGKWHTVNQVTATIEESLHGATEDQVREAVRSLRGRPPEGKRVETKSIGKQCQYRLVEDKPARGPASAAFNAEAKPDAIVSLYERVAPLIDELDQIGQMHEACMSPVAVRMVAAKLRRLFDAVLEAAAA